MTAPAAGAGALVVVGDVMVDVVARYRGALAVGSDTPALVTTRPGGAGANCAAWAGVAGAPVVFHGCVGDDALGREAVAALEACGVRPRIQVAGGHPTGTCVVLVDGSAERSMLPGHGANDALRAAEVWRHGSHLHLSAYTVLHPGSRDAGLAILAGALEAGMSVSIDAASAAMIREVGADLLLARLEGVDLMLLNRDEGHALVGTADPGRIAARLRGHCIGETVVKLGGEGAIWFDADGASVAVPAADPPGPVVDTTGAGDAFAGTLLARWVAGAARGDALRDAAAVAAAVCTEEGAWPRPGG